MKESIQRFQDLWIYQNAFEIAKEIYVLSKGFPADEKYSLTDQIRRSSRSICANIAEAWFKKSYPKHFESTLRIALSECAETLVWLDFAYDFGYLKQTEHLKLQIQAKQTITGLMKMINEVEKWSFKDKISEPEIPYLINTKAPLDFS